MSALRRNLPNISWKKAEQLPQDVLEKLDAGWRIVRRVEEKAWSA